MQTNFNTLREYVDLSMAFHKETSCLFQGVSLPGTRWLLASCDLIDMVPAIVRNLPKGVSITLAFPDQARCSIAKGWLQAHQGSYRAITIDLASVKFDQEFPRRLDPKGCFDTCILTHPDSRFGEQEIERALRVANCVVVLRPIDWLGAGTRRDFLSQHAPDVHVVGGRANGKPPGHQGQNQRRGL